MRNGANSARFCCAGCETVFGLLHDQGLERYYALASDGVPTAHLSARPLSHAWLAPLVEAAERTGAGLCTLELDVQGLHCAACVWLLDELYRRQQGTRVTVNPALGKLSMCWKRGAFDVARYVGSVEAFGYQLGPSRKSSNTLTDGLTWRLGVCVALTMNVMLFSIAFYLGLGPSEPELFHLFGALNLLLSTVVVWVGGWPFFKSALSSLRSGILHLDLPIALGIVLVYALSLAQAAQGRADWAYLDTLNVFITLMVTGRFITARVLQKNRNRLLEDDGAEGLLTRRRSGTQLEVVPAVRLRTADSLLIAPGDVLPVDAVLQSAEAHISTDWITGEPSSQRVAWGEVLPAGCFNADTRAFEAIATQNFSDSRLVALLRQVVVSPQSRRPHTQFFTLLAKGWVAAVLGIAAFGFLLWLPQGLERAVNVAVGLLVVTCPCAIGIALPLAYQLTHARLRKAGFYARREDVLDRLAHVRTLLFDKTGTLTLGSLELADPGALGELPLATREIAYNLAARSSHPRSVCIAHGLEEWGARFDPRIEATEARGCGVEAHHQGHRYRLGKPDWAQAASPAAPAAGTMLTRDGVPLATFAIREVLRADAPPVIERLQAAGFAVWLLSGDRNSHVTAAAARLSVPAAQGLGGLSPEAKAERVRALDRADTLYLGDGVNDALAFEAAYCAGTPAVDRPVMPGKSDFFLLGEGLRALEAALHQARGLRRAVRRVVAVSVAYNGVVVAGGLAGFLSPLRAAVAMPLSSLAMVALTLAWLRLESRSPSRGWGTWAEVNR